MNGYLSVTVTHGSAKKRAFYVHRLVADAFLPTILGTNINHRNGVKTDNRAVNLERTTPKQNTEHARAHDLLAKGERHGLAKLTDAIVYEMRVLSGQGHSLSSLARRHGVCFYTVKEAVAGRHWRHVPFPA